MLFRKYLVICSTLGRSEECKWEVYYLLICEWITRM